MKTILLVGSSIFANWSDVAEIAPDDAVTNRAVGGTITAFWTEHLTTVLAAAAPDAVLFYCGSNDINQGVPAETICTNVTRCRRLVHGLSTNTIFAYFSIIKAPQKQGKWTLIDRLNAAIRTDLPAGDLYVETNDVFFRDGRPVARYFVEDGLHLTGKAYATLSTYARPLIATWLGPIRDTNNGGIPNRV